MNEIICDYVNVYLTIEEKINLSSDKNLSNVIFRIITNNNVIFHYYIENINVGNIYWFIPDNKDYLTKESFSELTLNDEVIFRKKITPFYELIRDNKRKVIVQIGSNRGNDSLTRLVLKDDFILLVEPFDKFNDDLKRCYSFVKNLHIENLLIVDNDKDEEIIYSHRDMDWFSSNGEPLTFHNEQSSILKSHVLKHFPDESGLIEHKIKCITLNKLFEKYNLRDIDILFIDIEGLDDVVIRSIDFNKYNIHKIFYEELHINNEKLDFFLNNKGYNVRKKVLLNEMTTMAIKNKYKNNNKIYVQIGSNIGNDDFQRIIENSTENLRIFLIEPNKSLIKELSNNYNNLRDRHDIIIVNKGISIKNENVNLYLYDDSGHSSIIKRKTHPNKTSTEIECLSFIDFCNQYSIKDIDILSIDTEGMDYEILNSIDLSKINIKELFFEKWIHDNDDLNNKYRTGPIFLESHLIPKYKDYNWEIVDFDGMDTYKLTQKINEIYYRDLGKEGHGRLGNQFFEISATISLSIDNDAIPLFPDWEYNKYFKNGIKTTDTFDVLYEYHDNVFGYHPIPFQSNMNLHGYFQSDKYFKHHEKEIRETFELKEEYENIIRNKWNHLLKTNTVSIHVRRGDYLDNPTFHICPPMSYFKKSLKYIKLVDFFNPIENVLIFSDDINWCKENFIDDEYRYHFIENQSDIEDLFLMSYCKHNIITNSSFSWWGSWLNKNPKKIVCAPSQWFGDGWGMNWEDIYYDGIKIIDKY